MKKLRKVLCFCLFAGFATQAFSQSLRDYVCIVRGNLAKNSVSFLEEIKDDLNDRGYSRYAKEIEAYLKGSFGSGVVFYASDKKPYIITNRHVVGQAESANVTFENEDGSTSEYKELKIIAVDEDIDVAILALPESYKKAGLLFRDTAVTDGEEVWSAGFPGLAGEPMWQLGKGSVTNARAKIKELLNPDISTIIQHSAQVDGGNSGGPLLVTSSNTEAGYRIVGINTWKAFTREATNFSIPAKVVKDFVERSVKGGTKKISIDERVKQFVKSITNKDELVSNLGKYISNEMVSNFGKNSFTTCLQVAPSNVRNMVTQTFAVDPIEGLRYAIVYHVWKEFWDEDAPLKAEASSAEESTNGQKVTFTIDTVADPIESLWIEEQGNWRLAEFSTIKAEKEKKSATKKNKRKTGSTMVDGVELTEPYKMQLAIGLLYPFESKKPGFEFQLLGTWHYAAFGLFVQMQKANVLAEVSGLYETYEMRNINMISFGPVFRLQVPVAFHKFCLTPYGDIRLGFSNMGSITKDEKTSRLYVGAGGGLSFAFNVNENVAPFLSAGYVHSIFKPLGMSKNVSSEHTNAIVISLGVKVIER